jgi:ATP-dependent DNA ligase
MAVPSPPAPVLMVFDVMFHNGRDLTQLPLRERRVQLVDVLAGSERVFPVRRLAENGLKAWEQVLERGYEGLVAKDETSVYAGGVTRSWLKVKVPGWTDPEDRFKRLRLTRVRES